MCAAIGICTERTTTTTGCTVARGGVGVVTGVLVCICIAIELFGEITKVTGEGCVHTGICGAETITTNAHDGSGVGSEGSTGTSIVCVFSADGMVHAGTESGPTGICTGRTTTIIVITAERNGVGDDSGALVFTGTGCVPFIVITKDIGVVFAHIGISGGVVTTIASLSGGGELTSVWAVICTASVFCIAGLVLAGLLSADTGNCTDAITIGTACMASTGGSGDNSDALGAICTEGASCVDSGTAIGVMSDPIGTCGSAITTTGLDVGSTVVPRGWVAICIDCVCSNAGMVGVGSLSVDIGGFIVAMLTTIASMDVIDGLGAASSVLVIIFTVAAFFDAIIKDVGVMSVHIGTCTSETTTTGRLGGLGAGTGALVAISTACESFVVGTANNGLLSGVIGICTDATTIQCSERRRASLAGAAILSSILL